MPRRAATVAPCSLPAAAQVASLRALGLNIRRAKLSQGQEHRFYVTDQRTSEKAGAGV